MTPNIPRLKELLERCSPGPWTLTENSTRSSWQTIDAPGWWKFANVAVKLDGEPIDIGAANAAFIAAARNELPALIERVERLEAELKVMQKEAAQAAYTMLQPDNGITDTVWMYRSRGSTIGGTTLYEHLLGMAGIDDLTGDVDKDMETLREFIALKE